MLFFNRLTSVILVATLLLPVVPLEARTRRGDKFLGVGRSHEERKEWDAALEQYEKALAEDPSELTYQMAVEKARFQSATGHIDNGLKTRSRGQLPEALIEFQKAYTIYPGSTVAIQELQRTQDMIRREQQRMQQTGRESAPEIRALTPLEEMKRDTAEKSRRIRGVPELKPIDPSVRNLTLNNVTVKVLFDTVGKTAGLNVLWDPDYQNPPKNTLSVKFDNSTLEEALDYLAVITKSYWKALGPNTIFVTNDNPNKRRDFAEMVSQTFYLSNVSVPQELQEIVNAVRSVTELQRVVAFNSQNAIIVRGESDQVALAAKMIHDLDKPKSEVMVDIMVMEASTNFSRQLTTAVAAAGLNIPFTYTPRHGVTTTSDSGSGSGSGSGSSTSTTSVALNNLGLATSDVAITLPSALLQAVMSDTKTKTLQAPQIRTLEGVKAEIKIGEREPTATGSFQPGIGGVGINPLVNTQFTYIDVGVNVSLQARVHDNGDVGMHIELDVSTVAGHVNLGGIDQPIIGQRKITQEIRMRQGEVGLLGGLINTQETKQVTGIPGLSSIPLLRRLFTGDSTTKQRGELMIVLIPHIVRRPEITADNLRPIAVGNQTSIKLSFDPKPTEEAPAPAAAGAAPGAPGAVALPTPGGVVPAPIATVPTAVSPVPPAGTPAPSIVSTPNSPVGAPSMPVSTAPGGAMPPATAPPEATTTKPAAGAEKEEKPTGPRVRFSPAQIETSQANSLTVSLSMEAGADIVAAPLQIQYDPKMLSLDSVARGDFLSSDGQQAFFTKNVQNEAGVANIQLNRMPGAPGVNGSGVLVTLTFRTKAKGSTTVSVNNLAVKSSSGQVVASGSPQLVVNVK